MGRRKEDIARLDGMAYATRQIEAIGLDEFKRELAMRGRHDLALPVRPEDIMEASKRIKEMTLDTVLTMTVLVLHDEFGFGKKRCKQFTDRYSLKADCLAAGLVSWDDFTQIIKDELDLEIKIRLND